MSKAEIQELLKKVPRPIGMEFTEDSEYAREVLDLFSQLGSIKAGGRELFHDRLQIGILISLSKETSDPVKMELRQRVSRSVSNGLSQSMREFLERTRKGENVRPDDVPAPPPRPLVLKEDEDEDWPYDTIDIEAPLQSADETDAGGGREESEEDRIRRNFARERARTFLSYAEEKEWPDIRQLDELPMIFRLILFRLISLDINYPGELDTVIGEKSKWRNAAGELIAHVRSMREWCASMKVLVDNVEAVSEPMPGFQEFRPAQTAVAWLTLQFKGILDASDMGVGKTLGGALTSYVVPDAKVTAVLVPNSVKAQTLSLYRAFYRPLIERGEMEVVDSVRRAQPEESGRLIVIDSITQLQLDGPAHAKSFLSRIGQLDLVIVDEAHSAKSEDSNRTEAIRILASKAKYTLLQTGTPLVVSLEDTRQVIKMVAKPGSEIWRELEYDNPDRTFKPCVGDAVVLGNAYESVTFRVLNQQRIPKVRTIALNEDGDNEGFNEVAQEDLLRVFRSGSITSQKYESIFMALKLPAAVEIALDEKERGGITMISMGEVNGSLLAFVSETLREAGLRVAEYHGEIPVDERDLVIRRVQKGAVDVVLCNHTAALGVTGFQGDDQHLMPGRVTAFVDLIHHSTPAIRDQHYRRAFRTRGDAKTIAPVDFYRLEAWVELNFDGDEEPFLRSYDAFRNSVLRERSELFDIVIDGKLSADMRSRDFAEPLSTESIELRFGKSLMIEEVAK